MQVKLQYEYVESHIRHSLLCLAMNFSALFLNWLSLTACRPFSGYFMATS